MRPRRLTPELLDSLPPDDPRARRSRRDLRRINRCLLHERYLIGAARGLPAPPATIVDLGAGDGWIAARLATALAPRWPDVRIFLVDALPTTDPDALRRISDAGWIPEVVQADAVEWLRRDAGRYDWIFANLFLHHFEPEPLAALLGAIRDRAGAFLALEPHRGRVARFGCRLLPVLGCDPITLHDARVSVEAGFSGTELSTLWGSPDGWDLSETNAPPFSHRFLAIRRPSGGSKGRSGSLPSRASPPNRSTPRTITIAGGGLAGLVLGIALRDRQIPVVLHEAGRYPRHRVCGEFLSGNGPALLESLNLLPALRAAGARTATTFRFASDHRQTPIQPLPAPALAISRHALDALLATTLRERGGEVHEESRNAAEGEGIVDATGRRRTPPSGPLRWIGLKMHLLGAEPSADLEMHLTPDGYVGLCRVEGGAVNVCGLFLHDIRRGAFDPVTALRGRPGSLLHERFGAAAEAPGSRCAVSALDLRPQPAIGQPGPRIGDAATMIPPFTGNGMSMAIESALLATDPLAAWARGECDWQHTLATIARRTDTAFRSRLRWAARIHPFLLSPRIAPGALALLSHAPSAWRFLFAHTR